MTRKRTEWKVRGGSLTLGERTLVMGILNVTPDSFSDGGSFAEPDAAVEHALRLERAGADIIDVGAESTRPDSERISAAEELRRLIPVLKRLKGRLEIPICVDTYKPEVAERALEHGAVAINDVSGLLWEPDLARVVRDSDGGLILNHTRGTPDQWLKQAPMRDVMGEIVAGLESSVHRARQAGMELNHLVVDPGIGFGKRKEQNSELLARLHELQRLLLPVLAGPSRKSFLAQDDPQSTEYATAAAVAVAIMNGVVMVRVHDVAACVPVVAVCDAILNAAPEPPEEKPAKRSARQAQRDRDAEDEERKRPVRVPVVGVVRVPDEPPPPPAANADTEEPKVRPAASGRSEPLIRELRPSDRGDAPRRRDEGEAPRKYGPPKGRDEGGAPRKFGPPRGRDEGDAPRKYGPPRGRDEGGAPRKFGPPRGRDDDRPAPRKFGPPRGRDEGDAPRKYGPPRGRDEGGAPRKFGPPRGRDDDRPAPRKFGPPRGRDEGDAPRKYGPPRGRDDDRPTPRKFGPARGRDEGGPPRKAGPPRGRDEGGSPRKFGPSGGKGGPGKKGGGRGPSTPPRRKD